MFIFLGWFLLSVKNNKFSIKVAWTGFVVEKLRNSLSINVDMLLGSLAVQEYIIQVEEDVGLTGALL